jgi:hypothetical protein
MTKRRNIAVLLSIIVAVFLLIWLTVLRVDEEPALGVTYSVVYAEELGLDSEEVYMAVLEELQPSLMRIPVYWSRYEQLEGGYDFTELDQMMDLAAEHDVDVTLAIGQKVPRWPECFIPEFYLDDDVRRGEALLDYVGVVVQRYQDHSALARWQVENESYFPFGECPAFDPRLLSDEVALVKRLDPDTSIQLTISGEQSFWAFHAMSGDVLGVSLYREVENSAVGPLLFPLSPQWYRVQMLIAELFTDEVIISELQMEPWGVASFIANDGTLEGYDHFTTDELASNLTFARQTGIDEVYFWGVEWWYLLRSLGDARLWDEGMKIMENRYEEI